jgi:FMN phosphatase YigB (HAD superfamily)
MGLAVDDRPVFFFDIDNCLYPRSKKVHDHMQRLIDVSISHPYILANS